MQVYTPTPISYNYHLSLFESGDIKPWLQSFIECADAHMLSSQARLQLVPTFLAGQAESWHGSIKWSSWEEWCTAAVDFFCDSPSPEQVSIDIATIKADQFSDQYIFLEQFQKMLFNFFSGNSIYTLENPQFFEIQKYRSLHLFLDSLHPADAAGVETFEPKDVYEAISIYSKYASRPEVRFNDVFPKMPSRYIYAPKSNSRPIRLTASTPDELASMFEGLDFIKKPESSAYYSFKSDNADPTCPPQWF